MQITEELYLSDAFPTREALEEECDFWDATTASRYAWCPRHGQLHGLGLQPRGDALQLYAGSALHAALHALYIAEDEALAMELLQQTFGTDRPMPAPGARFGHLHLGFLEIVLQNYFTWRKKHDTFKPIIVHMDELDLTDVVAAMFQVLPDERVILGESKLVIRFEVDEEEFFYAGRPDLPIVMGSDVLVMDHKSTSGRLSDYWAEKHIISNQLRGYCAMMQKVLRKVLKKRKTGKRVAGALINGIYVGEDATRTHTKSGKPSTVTRFSRFGPWLYDAGHLEEAVVNQWWWRNQRFLYREFAQTSKAVQKFGWGQHTGKVCQGCPYLPICQAGPKVRTQVIMRDYERTGRSFLDL